MLTSQSISVPGLHGRFLVDRLPDWLKHATVADLKRWRESQRPAQLNPSGSSAWFLMQAKTPVRRCSTLSKAAAVQCGPWPRH